MTDRTQPEAGSTHIIRYALELGLLWIDGSGRDKVREALDALDALEAKLTSIGAGGVQAPQPAPAPLSDPRITAIEQAIRDYHYALDCRKHGGVAEVQAFGAICNAMKMDWVQGQESERRAALAAQGGK